MSESGEGAENFKAKNDSEFYSDYRSKKGNFRFSDKAKIPEPQSRFDTIKGFFSKKEEEPNAAKEDEIAKLVGRGLSRDQAEMRVAKTDLGEFSDYEGRKFDDYVARRRKELTDLYKKDDETAKMQAASEASYWKSQGTLTNLTNTKEFIPTEYKEKTLGSFPYLEALEEDEPVQAESEPSIAETAEVDNNVEELDDELVFLYDLDNFLVDQAEEGKKKAVYRNIDGEWKEVTSEEAAR